MDKFKRKGMKEIGPGGLNCPCCGPSPKHRGKLRKRCRSRLRQADHHLFSQIQEEILEADFAGDPS